MKGISSIELRDLPQVAEIMIGPLIEHFRQRNAS
jgi:hypothetical protein